MGLAGIGGWGLEIGDLERAAYFPALWEGLGAGRNAPRDNPHPALPLRGGGVTGLVPVKELTSLPIALDAAGSAGQSDAGR